MKFSFRFSLFNLFLAVTIAAISVFLWIHFVAANITGVTINEGQVVFHISDRISQKGFELANDPYDYSNATAHDRYISVAIPVVMMGLAAVGIVGLLLFMGIALARRRR